MNTAPSSGLPIDTPRAGAAPRARSLRRLAVTGSVWTVGGYVALNVLRLGSNLVLTRLLVPEAFGLMALVAVFVQGLQMFSDFGVQSAVVQHRRGDEPGFLNTAWTLQVVRGALLFTGACLLAWPAGALYGEPTLSLLLPAAAVGAMIEGFNSTGIITARRHLTLARLTVLDVSAYTLNIAVMVTWASLHRTVWALIAGGIVGSIARLILSYALFPGSRNRFCWDRDAAQAMFHFGKWIFLSTAVGLLALHADRLLMGRYLGVAVLGVYSIALYMGNAVPDLVTKLTRQVIYPAMSQVARDNEARVREVYYRVRLRLDLLGLPAAGAIMVSGTWIVAHLYDPRYAEAGWMLQLLAVRAAMMCMLTPCETCLFSIGHTRYGFTRNVGRAIWVVAGIPIGWWLMGVEGIVWAVALSEIPVLFILWRGFIRHRLFDPLLEARSLAFLAAGWGVGLLLIQLP